MFLLKLKILQISKNDFAVEDDWRWPVYISALGCWDIQMCMLFWCHASYYDVDFIIMAIDVIIWHDAWVCICTTICFILYYWWLYDVGCYDVDVIESCNDIYAIRYFSLNFCLQPFCEWYIDNIFLQEHFKLGSAMDVRGILDKFTNVCHLCIWIIVAWTFP